MCLLVLQPFPLLHDYPEWVYQGWIFQQLLEDQSAVAVNYQLVKYPVPNSLSQVVVGLLMLVLSAVLAAKLWLGIYLLGAFMLCWHVWRRYRDAAQVVLLTSVVILGPGFWNGYMNFQFAVLLFGAYLLMSTDYQHNFIVRLLWSLLIFFAHAVVFGVFIIYCVVSTWCHNNERLSHRMRRDVALLPSLALLGWYAYRLLASYVPADGEGVGLIGWVQYKTYTLAKQGPFHNYILYNGESLLERVDWFYKIGFLTNFVFAVLLFCWFIWLVWSWLFGGRSPVRSDMSASLWSMLLSVAVCVVVFLIAGSNTFGVVNLGERFLIAALLIVLLGFTQQQYLRQLMAAFSSVFLLYLIGANVYLSTQTFEAYSVSRSSSTSKLTDYVDDIYANSSHKYFNHRLFIYADRGLELLKTEPNLLDIDLETSVIRRVK